MNRLAEILKMNLHPVAIYRAPELPEDASVPQGHCAIPSLLVKCARTGKKCAADRAHIFCHGALSGFGFGGIPSRQRSAWSASVVPEDKREGSHHKGSGQSYFRTPEIAMVQLDGIRDYGDGRDAIVFQDLDEAEAEGRPIEVVVFLADPARLTALQQLAAYSKTTPGPAAIMPFGHACQQVYAIPRAEGEGDDLHAVVGMTDMYARRFVDRDQLSFAVPYKLYQRMMDDIDGSFLQKEKFLENMERCL